MRLDKFLSNLKYGTRSEVQSKIKKGFVTVNGVTVKDSKTQINPEEDDIIIDGETTYYKKTILLIMNKPAGYLSTSEIGKQKTVFELLKEPYNRLSLNIAGRLDKDTEGLLLFTNDGDLLHNIITPKKHVYKKYYVKTELPFDISNIDKTYEILDGRDRPYIPLKAIAETISSNEFYLSIMEGKFHQVKRMVQHFDNEVIYLKRVSIGKIILDESLQTGEYKEIEDYSI
jgi:16S rRNA pseudouridine516 synthase